MENSAAIKGVDFAREAITTMARETKQKSARVALCRAIPKLGNYTPEAKALWSDYLAKDCPACVS